LPRAASGRTITGVQYDQGSDRTAHRLGEALAPYASSPGEAGPHAKVSISVPEPLLAAVRDVAEASGSTVSGVISAALRRVVAEAEQERLDAALEADRDENLAWTAATGAPAAALLERLEW
jgi:hypothetical protein